MDSPFYNNNSSIVFYLEPILNTYHKTYQNIITLSNIPNGPLSDMVSTFSATKLSPFQQIGPLASPTFAPHNCVHALLRYPKKHTNARPNMKNSDSFMTSEDIPALLSYLSSNGYSIQNQISDVLYKSNINLTGSSDSRLSGNRKFICVATYSTA